jgi:hypothetical protein
MIFVANMEISVYSAQALYDKSTISTPKADRSHAAPSGVGVGKFANLWDNCWVCIVFEAGMPATGGCNFTEEHVLVDAMF